MELRWCLNTDPAFLALTTALDKHLREQQGQAQEAFAPYNNASALSDAAVYYDGQTPVACCGLKLHQDSRIAEVKRMFVLPQYRGHGLARAMLAALESRAKEHGCTQLVLETNAGFTPAVTLYQQYGFKVIPNFGVYQCMDSLCMGKDINA